jgi:hypothetical protein
VGDVGRPFAEAGFTLERALFGGVDSKVEDGSGREDAFHVGFDLSNRDSIWVMSYWPTHLLSQTAWDSRHCHFFWSAGDSPR